MDFTSTIASLLPRLYDVDAGGRADRWCRRPRPRVRPDPRCARAGHAGRAPVPRVVAQQPVAGPAGLVARLPDARPIRSWWSEGRIAERGTHEEFLALGGRYAEPYRTQFATATAAA